MENGGPLVDIGSAAETVAAVEEEEVASVAPLHQIESLCMRCGENVISLSPIILVSRLNNSYLHGSQNPMLSLMLLFS